MTKLFGTDGVRGIAGKELSCELVMKIGKAIAFVLKKDGLKYPKILIGRDTRISGQMLESALVSGLCSMGADCFLVGVVATPAVSFLVDKQKFDAGIMISASHNPFEFNGIKIFNSFGLKLSDEMECEIENFVNSSDSVLSSVKINRFGMFFNYETGIDDYVNHVCKTVGNNFSTKLKVAVDCANGSACVSAVKIFKKLNIDAHFFNIQPNGYNINLNCGSTHIQQFANFIKDKKYDLGVAFDGDADRCLAVNEKGEIVDGDQLLAIFAMHMKSKGLLLNNTIVITIMSNLGVFNFAKNNDINLAVTKVGDRYVLQNMIENGYKIGGEQSGHIIFYDYAKTGDGQLTAIQLINCVEEAGKKFSNISNLVEKLPQVLVGVKANKHQKELYFKNEELSNYIEQKQKLLGKNSRILVRCSGTEPLIRIMIEGPNIALIKQTSQDLAEKIAKVVSL